MSKQRALLLMVLASVFWSIAGLFIKQISWHPIVIAGLRSAISGLFLWFFIDKKKLHFSKNIILGSIMYVFVAGLFVIANKLTTSTNAILLQFTAPIWVVVISILFLKQKPSKKDIAAVAIVLFGMVLFFFGDLQVGNVYGNILAILAGVSLAIMLIVMRGETAASPLTIPFFGSVILFVVSLPAIWLFPPQLTTTNVVNIVVLGVFQLGMGYLLFSIAIPYVSTLEASLIMVIEPLLNPIWVFLFIGEQPTIQAVIGGVIVIVSVLYYQISNLKSNRLNC